MNLRAIALHGTLNSGTGEILRTPLNLPPR